MSYYDTYVTTAWIPRTSIANLPFGVLLTCTRVGGWELWRATYNDVDERIAGEFHGEGLVIDVDGHVVVDSLNKTGD